MRVECDELADRAERAEKRAGELQAVVDALGRERAAVRSEAGALRAKLEQMGDDAKLTLGPLDMSEFIEGMRVAWISDPEGNIVELNQGYVDEASPPPAPLDR